jgi:hypothetical protein
MHFKIRTFKILRVLILALVNLESGHFIGQLLFICNQLLMHSAQNKEPHTSHSYGLHNMSRQIGHLISSSITEIFSRFTTLSRGIPPFSVNSVDVSIFGFSSRNGIALVEFVILKFIALYFINIYYYYLNIWIVFKNLKI